jgi:AcrR family transcriptional regulator
MMERVEDKRTAILDATLRLIAEKGFHGTAMSKVAKEAGVSAGIIYHYFSSKDDLIVELYKELKRKFADSILANFDEAKPLIAQIRQVFEDTFRYSLKYPRESAFMAQYSTSPYYRPEVYEEVMQYFIPIAVSFTRAQQEMLIKDLPLEVVAALSFDMASTLAKKQTVGLIALNEELIQKIINALWDAIRA